MKDKLLEFVRRNGFLLFLFVCVCIVGLSIYFIISKEVEEPRDEDLVILEEEPDNGEAGGQDSKEVARKLPEEEEPPYNQEEDELLENLGKEEGTGEDREEDLQETFAEEDDSEDDEEIEFIEDVTKIEEEDGFKFILPLEGEIITDFTSDTLVYSETLDEWRSHPGIDIKGELGSKVRSASDGVVKKAYEDPLWGNVIEIDHGKGLVTRYANLGTKDMVKVGLKVKLGDEIATIGKSASIEMLMDSHLHFEAIKDGKIVDPRSIK